MRNSVSIKLDADVHSRVKALAKARDRSPHWMMRDAINQYIEREEKREALRRDGIRAWESYQETGLHVTHAEADAWLDQLAAGDDQDPPKCHD